MFINNKFPSLTGTKVDSLLPGSILLSSVKPVTVTKFLDANEHHICCWWLMDPFWHVLRVFNQLKWSILDNKLKIESQFVIISKAKMIKIGLCGQKATMCGHDFGNVTSQVVFYFNGDALTAWSIYPTHGSPLLLILCMSSVRITASSAFYLKNTNFELTIC